MYMGKGKLVVTSSPFPIPLPFQKLRVEVTKRLFLISHILSVKVFISFTLPHFPKALGKGVWGKTLFDEKVFPHKKIPLPSNKTHSVMPRNFTLGIKGNKMSR